MLQFINRMLGQIKNDNGYNPEGKGEQDGKEHWARDDIRQSVMADAFSDTTRRARRSLLALSVLVLVINARLPIERIPYIGDPPSEESIITVLGVLSLGLVYFMIVFVASAGYEYLRWRLDGNIKVLTQTMDWHHAISDHCLVISQCLQNEAQDAQKVDLVRKAMDKALIQLPDIVKRVVRTENYYISTSRIQMGRMILLDLALPLTVSIIALAKVYALVTPMVSNLVTA